MLTYNDLWPHSYLLIYPQDSGKEKEITRTSTDVKELFLYLTGHADCKVANSRPICSSYNDLFDPRYPSPYQGDCSFYKLVYEEYQNLLSKKEGRMPFAQNTYY